MQFLDLKTKHKENLIKFYMLSNMIMAIKHIYFFHIISLIILKIKVKLWILCERIVLGILFTFYIFLVH